MIDHTKNEIAYPESSPLTLSVLEYIIFEYFTDRREEHRLEDLSVLKKRFLL